MTPTHLMSSSIHSPTQPQSSRATIPFTGSFTLICMTHDKTNESTSTRDRDWISLSCWRFLTYRLSVRHESLWLCPPPVLLLTSSSSLRVSSSMRRMSSMFKSIHLSIQQKSWRWKLVNKRFSCCEATKEDEEKSLGVSSFKSRMTKRNSLIIRDVSFCPALPCLSTRGWCSPQHYSERYFSTITSS